MADDAQVLNTAATGFAVQDAEFSAARERNMRIVRARYAEGNGNINEFFGLDRRFRLVYLRVCMQGPPVPPSSAAPLTIRLDSSAGDAFDCILFTMQHVAPEHDVNFRLTREELAEPSAWTFQPGDRINIQWTNPMPGTISWGTELGLARAT